MSSETPAFPKDEPLVIVGGALATERRAAEWCGGRPARASIGGYEILGRLAQGGLAEVWLGRLATSGPREERVAIKTIRPQLARSPEIIELFANEAAIAARLSHPNIVRIFDFGRLEEGSFLVMEHISGASLRQVAQRVREMRGAFPVPLLLGILAEVCRALAYAHGLHEGGRPLGFVHNDISPENVMLGAGGAVKLIDFGAARIATTPTSTRFVGKYRYASPERLRGERGDARSDVYALGVILYECLTGTKPFAGTDEALVAAILAGETADPRARARVSDDLAQVTMTAMAPRVEERHADAAALEAELRRCLQASGCEATPTLNWAELLQPQVEAAAPRLPLGSSEPPVSSIAASTPLSSTMAASVSAPASTATSPSSAISSLTALTTVATASLCRAPRPRGGLGPGCAPASSSSERATNPSGT